MAEEKLKEYTPEEVFAHTSEDDCWLVIGNESNGTFGSIFHFGILVRFSLLQPLKLRQREK